jgi:hypothetical protein
MEISSKKSLLIEDEKYENEISLQSKNFASLMTNIENEPSVEYKNYQERLKTKLFRYCEQGNIKKLKIILDRNQPNDAIPPINTKFLHDYSVLHIAVANSN